MTPLYPINFDLTHKWLHQFFEYRFMDFGIYEDAIVAENSILNHSVLTPMLNVGLISPKKDHRRMPIIRRAKRYSD